MLRTGSYVKAALPVIRGAFPAIAVATLIPLAVFYVALAADSVVAAIIASVVYAYSVALYQWLRRGRVSGMLLLTLFMVTVRGLAVAVSGQPFFFFAVPVVETAGFGLVFLATMFTSEPLIVRLARDFIPHLADDFAAHKNLIRSLSCIWSAVYLASGATTLALLTTQSLGVYMGAHQLTGWLWTGSGIVASVLLVRWRAKGFFASVLASRGPLVAAPVALVAA